MASWDFDGKHIRCRNECGEPIAEAGQEAVLLPVESVFLAQLDCQEVAGAVTPSSCLWDLPGTPPTQPPPADIRSLRACGSRCKGRTCELMLSWAPSSKASLSPWSWGKSEQVMGSSFSFCMTVMGSSLNAL